MANSGEVNIMCSYRHWGIFGSLTFGVAIPSAGACRKQVFAHLYDSAKLLRVPFRRLVWAIRQEHGERGGRLHYHVLIGSYQANITPGHCFTLNSMWENRRGCGFARHHVFDKSLQGVAYVTKCLTGDSTVAGDFYESAKFGFESSDLTLSDSLLRVVGGRRVCVLRQEASKPKRNLW